jgi:hypothetical protein
MINVERIAHNGHLVLTSITDRNETVKGVYIGYTVAEAKADFKLKLKGRE